MISKENLLKNFANEDKDSVIRIYNNLILAKNKDIPVFSKNFCSPNIWSYFVENFNKNDFIVEADGAYDDADRRIISFNNFYFNRTSAYRFHRSYNIACYIFIYWNYSIIFNYS